MAAAKDDEAATPPRRLRRKAEVFGSTPMTWGTEGAPISDDEAETTALKEWADPDATTDEEPEIPGLKRPKLGAGWWGRGPPLRPQRKGLVKTFYDGAGLPSPGRWPIKQRRLPDDTLANEIRDIFRQGLINTIKSVNGGDFKKMLLSLASGSVEANPFPEHILEEVRTQLRLTLKRHGVGDGLPREGDIDQPIEVRLIQDLLKAFNDPDAFFADWWATGVWLGSPSRRLPRTPAIYERKTKWPVMEGGPELHEE